MSRQAELTTDPGRISVVAGILSHNGRILLSDRAQARSMQDYWEFPGGKVQPEESPDAALCRELQEELGVTALQYEHFETVCHDYADLSVAIEFFVVTRWHGKPAGMEGQALRWVAQDSLAGERILPADAPIVAALCKR
ncbi:MAG: 8-oxo-dGTP diphosphatase MutT [Woeseiaceae bacterium]